MIAVGIVTEDGRSSRAGKNPDETIMTDASLAARTGETNPSVKVTKDIQTEQKRSTIKPFFVSDVRCCADDICS